MTSRRPPVASITTARLVLRRFQAGDLEQLRRIVDDPSVKAFSPDEPRAIAAAEHAERGGRNRHPADFEFAIVVRRTGRVAGACELVIGPRRSGEIGYLLGRRHWGHGYATEAVQALVSFGFDGLSLNRLHAIVSLDNARSRRVLEKVGFCWDALLRRPARTAGRALDAERYVRDFDMPVIPPCRNRRIGRS